MGKGESKREAFRRLATKRTNAVLDRLRILGNCANPQLYEYNEDDVRKIFLAVEKEVRSIRAKFKGSTRQEFEL